MPHDLPHRLIELRNQSVSESILVEHSTAILLKTPAHRAADGCLLKVEIEPTLFLIHLHARETSNNHIAVLRLPTGAF